MKSILCKIFLIGAYFIVTAFSLDNAVIPKHEILSGGPPKDGIPAILKPKFVSAEKAEFMKSSDGVIGVILNGQAKAYPVKILNWHEVVNDKVGETPLVVSY